MKAIHMISVPPLFLLPHVYAYNLSVCLCVCVQLHTSIRKCIIYSKRLRSMYLYRPEKHPPSSFRYLPQYPPPMVFLFTPIPPFVLLFHNLLTTENFVIIYILWQLQFWVFWTKCIRLLKCALLLTFLEDLRSLTTSVNMTLWPLLVKQCSTHV